MGSHLWGVQVVKGGVWESPPFCKDKNHIPRILFENILNVIRGLKCVPRNIFYGHIRSTCCTTCCTTLCTSIASTSSTSSSSRWMAQAPRSRLLHLLRCFDRIYVKSFLHITCSVAVAVAAAAAMVVVRWCGDEVVRWLDGKVMRW